MVPGLKGASLAVDSWPGFFGITRFSDGISVSESGCLLECLPQSKLAPQFFALRYCSGHLISARSFLAASSGQ